MSKTDTRVSFCFPQIEEIRLTDFSLFPHNRSLELKFDKSVLCFAGANGIGKSSLLSAVNFALTGLVPALDRKFSTLDKYVSYAGRHTSLYFKGRIADGDYETADISLDVVAGGQKAILTRSFAEPGELRALTISASDGAVVYDGTDHTGADKNSKYEAWLTGQIGLNSFNQYVFLQHFVFTFDEHRYLLFWARSSRANFVPMFWR